jgi:hypothetical protein
MEAKMKRHPLRRIAQVGSCVVFAMICLQSGAAQARADAPIFGNLRNVSDRPHYARVPADVLYEWLPAGRFRGEVSP